MSARPHPEYAGKGLAGLLSPQANTTAEPEFAALMPADTGWLNARLTSSASTITARLADYMASLAIGCDQFGGAPLQALALGCTGTAYVVGGDEEDRVLGQLADQFGAPAFSAATATLAALDCLQARKVLLVSPYEDRLHQAGQQYWVQRGRQAAHPFEITDCVRLSPGTGFHPIYTLHSEAIDQALRERPPAQQSAESSAPVDAIVVLGTGLPTLAALLRVNAGPYKHQGKYQSVAMPTAARPVLLSCMLCLGWQTAAILNPEEASAERLLAWARGEPWAQRFRTLFPALATSTT